MPHVVLAETILSAPDVVAVALVRSLERLAWASRHGDLALLVPLQTFGRPGLADISVPVVLSYDPQGSSAGGERRIRIRLHARVAEGLFPTFSGALRVHRVTDHRTDVILDGTYTPPGGKLGSIVDATILHDAARLSLRTLLRRIGDDVVREIETPELLFFEQSRP